MLPRCLLLMTMVCSACTCQRPEGHHFDGPLYVPPALPVCTAAFGATTVACPAESEQLAVAPHVGFNSFYRTNATQPTGAPKGSVAYTRYWWSDLEPAEGQVDFGRLDADLDEARAQGQQVAFRVMPEESAPNAQRVPAWLAQKAGGTWGTHNGVRYFSPDYDSPAYLEAVERFLSALGARYGDDPVLDHVEVGLVGDSGEWSYAVDGAPMPSPQSARRIIDAHRAAFPLVPVLMMVGAVDDGALPLRYAVAQGAGWRADCWGDIRKAPWNHHDDFYEQRLEAADAGEAWRRAPVMLETCGVMSDWDALGFEDDQVRWLLHWALEKHASQLNNKSTEVPSRWRGSVDEALRSLGYRLVAHEVRASWAGTALDVTVLLANRGVAPFYHPLQLELRARANGQVLATQVLPEPLALLADTQQLSARLALTAPSGSEVTVELKLRAPDGWPSPLLMNEGRDAEGWLPALTLLAP